MKKPRYTEQQIAPALRQAEQRVHVMHRLEEPKVSERVQPMRTTG